MPNRFAEGYALGQQILEQRGKKRGQEFLRSLLSPKEYALSQIPGGLGYLGGLERLSATEESERQRMEAIPEELRPFVGMAETFGQETTRPFMREAGVLPEKETTAKEQMSRQEGILWDMFQKGEFTAKDYKEKLSLFAQRRVKEMKLFPEEEEVKRGKTLSAKEQKILGLLQIKPSKTPNHLILWMNKRAGYEVDTEKDEWKPRTADAMDFFQMMMGGTPATETKAEESTDETILKKLEELEKRHKALTGD